MAIRFSNAELPPFWGATLRFGAASLLFFAFVFWQRVPLPRGRALAGVLIFGVLGFAASYALGYWALLRVQAGMAQVILALVPLLTLLLALLHGLESFHWRGLFGALLAVAGIAIMFGSPVNAAVPLPSLLAILAGAACIAEAGIVIKWFPPSHPAATNALAMATGTGILMALSALWHEPWVIPNMPATWAALAYLVLVGSVPVFLLYLFVLKRWPASSASYQFVLFPFVTVTLSAWLEKEPVTLALLLGGALVLAGVYVGALAQSPGKQKANTEGERRVLGQAPGRQNDVAAAIQQAGDAIE